MVRCTHQQATYLWSRVIFIIFIQNMVGILLGQLRPVFQYLINFQQISQNSLKPHFGGPVNFSSSMF